MGIEFDPEADDGAQEEPGKNPNEELEKALRHQPPKLPSPEDNELAYRDEVAKSIVEDFVAALDLPDQLKEALRIEALAQLEQIQRLGWWSWLFDDSPATLEEPASWTESERLSPEEAKSHVDAMVRKLNLQITDIRDPELTQRFQHLADELNGLSFQLASSAPIINVLREQFSVAQATGEDFLDLEAQLAANIMNHGGLNDDQKLSAKAELHSWNEISSEEGPSLHKIAPRIVKDLRLASENSASLLAELVNSGLIQPQKFASLSIVGTPQPDRSHLAAHELSDSTSECVEALAEMMTFIAQLSAEIKALDKWTSEEGRWTQ